MNSLLRNRIYSISPVSGLMLLIVAGYAAVKYLIFAGIEVVSDEGLFESRQVIPRVFGDTKDYIAASNNPLFSTSFLARGRPIGIPFLLKFIGEDPNRISVVQGIFSGLGSLVFSLGFWSLFRNKKFGLIAFVGALAWTLSVDITLWERVILSESMTISLLMASIGFWMIYLVRRNRLSLIFALLSMSIWMLAKDAHSIGVIALLPMAIYILYRYRSSRNWIVVAVITGVAVLGYWSAEASNRAAVPFYNVIAQRILPVPEYADYFVEAGMPDSELLRSLSGGWASSQDRAFLYNPELEEFREWVRTDSKLVYARFLLSHPSYLLTKTYENKHRFLWPSVTYYAAERWINYRVDSMFGRLHTKSTGWWAVLFFFAVCGAVVTHRTGDHSSRSLVYLFVATFVIGFVSGVLAWHADALEPGRHGIVSALMVNASLWGLLAVSLAELARGYSFVQVWTRLLNLRNRS